MIFTRKRENYCKNLLTMDKPIQDNKNKGIFKKLKRFILFQYYHRKRLMKLLYLKCAKCSSSVYNIQGNKMLLDLKDKGISTDLILDGVRESISVKIMKEELEKGDIVVDIGANIGYYALIEAKIIGSKGMVYAIEPSPRNFERLQRNVKLNDCSNMALYQTAIGDRRGIEHLNISLHSNLNSVTINKNKKTIDRMEVNIITLDEFLKGKQYPNLIRMDLEGYEYNVIKGMKNTLKDKKSLKLFIEFHPHLIDRKKTLFVLKTLKDNGFETKKITRCFTETEMKVRNDFDYSYLKINDLMNEETILNGGKGGFEIFFERN